MKLYLDNELVEGFQLTLDSEQRTWGTIGRWTLSVDRWRPTNGPGSTVDVELRIGDVALVGKARVVQGEGIGSTSDLEGSSELTVS